VGVRSGNIDQLFVFSNDDALNIDMSNLAATWNASGTTFTAVKMNVTDTASAAASLLLDLQVGGTSQFKVSKGGRVTAQTLTIGLGGQTALASNAAVGYNALNSASLTGEYNTGVGYQALRDTTSGSGNAALGTDALRFNTSGGYCAAVGLLALGNNTTGSSNAAFGANALQNNTEGNDNNAFGLGALLNNTTGSNSTAIGHEAAFRFVASQNTAIGYRALRGGDATPANNTGTNNIAIGFQAGDAITTGSTNIVIGHDIDVDSATGSNQINIGGRYFHDRIRLLERSSDPAKPAEGNVVIWMSDGTGLGDDGDIMIGSTAGGVTNYGTLFDHSGGTLWP
jgi:hypothetical protein